MELGICQMKGATIRTEKLGKRYASRAGPIHALEDLDLVVEPGEIFGLLGPNGAGKTTTVRLLCGLLRPSEGQAWIDGVSVAAEPTLARARIGLVPEDAGHYRQLTVAEELTYYGTLFGLDRQTVARRSRPLLERLELGDRIDHRLQTFSKGMRRKVHLVRALLHEPRVLLLDEPTAGLDPAVSEEVWTLLRDLSQERAMTIVLCSHHLEEVERLCGRIAILRRRLLLQGPLSSFTAADGRHRIRVDGSAEDFLPELQAVEGLQDLRADGDCLSFAAGNAVRRIVPEAVRRLVAGGASVLSVEAMHQDLRSLYRTIVPEPPTAGGDA
jgi:ABC-2 type transport system ATP-binding protein